MSTITYRDGVMAADSRAYSGDSAPIGHKMKIHRLLDGSLLGVTTGQVGLSEALVKWFNQGCPSGDVPETSPSFSALHIKFTGEVFYYSDAYTPCGPLAAPFFAIGSGLKYALGAMSMGADAVRAVYMAAEHDIFTGAPVVAINLVDSPVEAPVAEAEPVAPAPEPAIQSVEEAFEFLR